MDVVNNNPNMPHHFRSSTKTQKESNPINCKKIHGKYSDVFTGIGCFEDMYKLQVRQCNCPYQTLPGRVAYVLQEPLKGVLD